MRLYAGTSENFIRDTVRNQIADKLKASFFDHYRYQPSAGEVNSWRNSLRAVGSVFEHAGLDDHGVILEYQLPLTSRRLDCLICGKDDNREDNAVIIELKQWEKCGKSNGENLVTTWVGGAQRDILHPSAQVGQYHRYLADTHTAFYKEPHPVRLSSCSYLHNYAVEKEDAIFDSSFKDLLKLFPIFTADDFNPLKEFLIQRLYGGEGISVLKRIEQSRYRPSKKLMDHVGNIIRHKPEFILLDEQLLVYEKVFACAREGFHDRKKTVLIVKGGPGTGKSVIAINLMSELLLGGYNSYYATGSRAFTQTLRKIIGSRGGVQFNYFNSYSDAERDAIDVLICDEAHRIRETSSNRFTPRAKKTGKAQIDELIDAAKVGVFLIDDNQVVRANEIGSSDYIREHADAKRCKIFEYKLEVQFRCAGSDGFVNWVNNTLGIERTANVLWDSSDDFDFQILDSPHALEREIRKMVHQGYSARITAGFCWPWSKPRKDGTLINDVVIGDYQRSWNAKSDAGRLAPGIPKEALWAYDPNGVNQIGCVYTAQGFEFDYVGVIFGEDLVYDFDAQGWVGHKEKSFDNPVKRSGDKFTDLIKNTYRVLLSRGLKGCYVHFLDKDTERFIRSRMEKPATREGAYEGLDGHADKRVSGLPFRLLSKEEANPFENCIPLYDLKIAASGFSDEQQVDDFEWVELPEAFRPSRDLFVAQVVGESMNRKIPNGSWCLFRRNPAGTRQGKVVLVQHREINDSEMGGHYTVKVYRSTKVKNAIGEWRHSKITLMPDSSQPGFEAIELSEDQVGELRVIAELVAVLS